MGIDHYFHQYDWADFILDIGERLMSILSIHNLEKRFKKHSVINGLSFEVNENEIYGFIGANGSGKTTTMKMILGLLKKDSGTIKVCGEEVHFGETKTNRNIGYLPDVPQFYNYMTAREYMRLVANITEVDKAEADDRIESLLEVVGLRDVKSKIKTYSRGMKQRLGMAQALIHKPKLLICDEPTSALDPKGRKEILDIMQAIRHETTIIFSTHILSDVERVCDRVGILHEGKIAASIDLNEQTFKNLGYRVEMSEADAQKLQGLGFIEKRGDSFTIPIEDSKKLYELLSKHEIYPDYIKREKQSLEDIYLEVTS